MPCLLDLLDKLCVYAEVAERCAVLVAARCCGACEIVVMRGAEQEDAFTMGSQCIYGGN